MYGSTYCVEKIEKAYGGYTGGYSGYISSDGNVSISRDYAGDIRTEGYRVYNASVSRPKPKKEW